MFKKRHRYSKPSNREWMALKTYHNFHYLKLPLLWGIYTLHPRL